MTRNTPNDTLNRKPTLVKVGRAQTRLFKRLVASALRLGYFAAATAHACALKLRHLAKGNACNARVRDDHETRDINNCKSITSVSCAQNISLLLTIISAYIRKIVTYENIFYVLRFEKRSANVFNDAYSTTNAFQRRHCTGDRSYKRRSSQDVVLITVLTQKVTCVLLFDTYENKVELSLRHYYKTHTPHGGILRSSVCVI